jgi:predicted O-methyltransferase YrrM
VNADRRALLDRLYAEGTAYDATQPDRLRRRRNLEPDSARLLTVVLRVAAATRIVEIGTSNGYSTIWLADAAEDVAGRVTTVDTEAWPGVAENLAAAGVAGNVDVVLADGGGYLAGLPTASVDLLFLDAERVEYPGWWPHPARVLRPGGVLAVDNVLSHPDEVAPFLALVAEQGGFVGTTATVGKGLHLAWRTTVRV